MTQFTFSINAFYVEICGFRFSGHEINKVCALLGYYAAYGGNSLPTFRVILSVHLQWPIILISPHKCVLCVISGFSRGVDRAYAI